MVIVELSTKWSSVGVRISTLPEVLAPWQAPTELSATLAELYALGRLGQLGKLKSCQEPARTLGKSKSC